LRDLCVLPQRPGKIFATCRYSRVCDGGFATHAVADARYCFPLGEGGDDARIAPWLCAGLIGWRSYRMAGDGRAGAGICLSRGGVWAGASEELPPEPLNAAIIFAPVGALEPAALMAVKKGGRVVCGGIHVSDIPSFCCETGACKGRRFSFAEITASARRGRSHA
jgi:D-arabinose 1-dehydrogenase-like Zn-dependent alcohol dehydrogenase